MIKKNRLEEVAFAFSKLEILRKEIKRLDNKLKATKKVYNEYWRETTQFYDGFDKDGKKTNYHIFQHFSGIYAVRDGCNVFNKVLYETTSHKNALEWIFEQIGVEDE